MSRLLSWLDKHILELVAAFLLVLIPLYPKWPLLDVFNGYNVRIRLEDFVVLSAVVILLVQVVRKKVDLRKNPLLIPIVVYWIIGLLSSLSALFITKTVPLEFNHAAKLFLHWIRRVEYMSLAFIFFAAITSIKTIKRFVILLSVTGILVALYGFGQKYWEWPVYSTMNREFAKGWRLVLTEHARVSSTFAGHYDLAAYVLVIMMLGIALFLLVKNRKARLAGGLVYSSAFAILLLTASRTSFVAYLGALVFIFLLLFASRQLKWYRAGAWLGVFLVISFVGYQSFGSLSERFAHVRLHKVGGQIAQLTIGRFLPDTDNGDVNLSGDLALVVTPTDTPPTPVNDPDLPPDVFEAIPLSFAEASLSAVPATAGTGDEGKARDYSSAAFDVGLSSAIRFDALWPRALAGFKKNPLLGSGYSTLVKEQTTDFTEAESTDNDYLRALGETGLLGVLSFVGILVFALYQAWKLLQKTTSTVVAVFVVGFMAGLVGLMINALYIDVFVSSKVAYLVWAMMGILFGAMQVTRNKTQVTSHKRKIKR